MTRLCFIIRRALTGNSSGGSPVLVEYMSLKTSKASSDSPHSSKNLGLSGNKNSHSPMMMLGMEQTVTKRFQLAYLKLGV